MSLTRILFELPTDRLREIVRVRASTIRGLPRINNKHDLARALASALTNYDSVQRALRGTSLPQFRVLTSVIVRGGTASFADLAQDIDERDLERLEQAVNSLENLGLAFWTENAGSRVVFVPRGVAQNIPLPAPLRLRLEVALEAAPAAALQSIASIYDVGDTAGSRKALSAAIREVFRNPELVHQSAAALSEEGAGALEALIDSGGVESLQAISQVVETRKRRQVMDLSWSPYPYDGEPRNGVEEILSRGLAFLDQVGAWGGGRIVVPIEVLESLTGGRFTQAFPSEPAWEASAVDIQALQAHHSLVRDVVYLFGFIRRNETPRTNAGVMYRTAIKGFARGTTIANLEYAEFIYAVASEAGLIATGGRKSLYGVTKRGAAWLALKPDAQGKALFDAWRGGALWDEAFDAMLADGKSYRSAQDAREYRDAVIDLISDAARNLPDKAISMVSLAERAEFNWWARFRFDADNGAGDSVRSNVELVRRIAGKSLYWLGLTTTASDAQGNPAYFALTGEGRRRLGIDSTNHEPPPGPEKFILQPNLEVFAPPNMPAMVLHRLFGMTEPAGRTMLSLTRESLRQAFDGGETSESILQFLRAHSQTGISQNVEYLVNEVGSRHGQIEVGHAGLYLKVDEPHLLRELEAQRNLKIGFRRFISENIALITGESVDGILKVLRQAGYLPVSSEEKNGAKSVVRSPRRSPNVEEEFEVLPRSSVAEVDGRIDWESVASADGLPYVAAEAKPSNSNGATPSYIEKLAIRAIEDLKCLEIVYKPADGSSLTQRVVEPHDLNGPILYAYCRLREDWRNFNIRCIQSARLTGETFEPRD